MTTTSAPARREEPREQGLADLPRAEDRDAPAWRDGHAAASLGRQRDQPAAEAGDQVDAREAGPFAVRLEQLGRLPRLDRPAASAISELHEAEVADEPVLLAAEPLEADDADRPRPEPALALEPGGDGVGRARRAAARARASGRSGRASRPRLACRPSARSSRATKRASVSQSGGAWSRDGRRRGARTIGRSISRARRDSISWPAERAQQRLRDRADAERPRPCRCAIGRARERVVRERGGGTRSGRRRARASSGAARRTVARAADDDRAVAELRRERLLVADDRAENAVAPDPGRVGRTRR